MLRKAARCSASDSLISLQGKYEADTLSLMARLDTPLEYTGCVVIGENKIDVRTHNSTERPVVHAWSISKYAN